MPLINELLFDNALNALKSQNLSLVDPPPQLSQSSMKFQRSQTAQNIAGIKICFYYNIKLKYFISCLLIIVLLFRNKFPLKKFTCSVIVEL